MILVEYLLNDERLLKTKVSFHFLKSVGSTVSHAYTKHVWEGEYAYMLSHCPFFPHLLPTMSHHTLPPVSAFLKAALVDQDARN